jgi:hypothetical protein
MVPNGRLWGWEQLFELFELNFFAGYNWIGFVVGGFGG